MTADPEDESTAPYPHASRRLPFKIGDELYICTKEHCSYQE